MMHGLESIFDIYIWQLIIHFKAYIYFVTHWLRTSGLFCPGADGGGGGKTPMPYGKVADALDLSYGYKSTALVSLRVFTIKHH